MVGACSIEFIRDHVVSVTFEDGSRRDINLGKYLHGGGWEEIRTDPARFREVAIEDGALRWPNGADICPDVLYYDLPLAGRPMSKAAGIRLKRFLESPSRFEPSRRRWIPPPGISWFDGITITMKFDRQGPPQFLARHENAEASFAIESLRVLKGNLPPRATGYVREWAEIHRDELSANWVRARRRQPLQPIARLE